jgi:hypothetical protein
MYELGALVLIIVAAVAMVKVLIVNPYRGVRHVSNAIRPGANKNDKEESIEVIKEVGHQASNYLGFMGTFFVLILASLPISLLKLPYIVNLFLGITGAVLLLISYNYFQNRQY